MEKNKIYFSKETRMRVGGALIDYIGIAKSLNDFYYLVAFMQDINTYYWLVRFAKMRTEN